MACPSSSSEEFRPCSYDEIPLQALNISLRGILSKYLNKRSYEPVNRGMARGMQPDWRGLAEITGHFDVIDIMNIEQREKDPLAAVLDEWMKKQDSSVGRLLEYLNALQCVELIDEIQELLERDVQSYLKRKEKSSPVQVSEVSGGEDINVEDETEIMTLDDEAGRPAMYDGFVCVSEAPEDMAFVREMLDILEGQYKLKLCLGSRDFLAGTSHSMYAAVIHKRCRRMVIIMSPQFADNPACIFQVEFAQSKKPGSMPRRLIPIVYKHFDENLVPYVLRHIPPMDFTQAHNHDNAHDVNWLWLRVAKTLASPLKRDSERSNYKTMNLSFYDSIVGVGDSSESDSQRGPQENEPEVIEQSYNQEALNLCCEQIMAMKRQQSSPQSMSVDLFSSPTSLYSPQNMSLDLTASPRSVTSPQNMSMDLTSSQGSATSPQNMSMDLTSSQASATSPQNMSLDLSQAGLGSTSVTSCTAQCVSEPSTPGLGGDNCPKPKKKKVPTATLR